MNLVNFLRQRSETKRQNRLISKWNSIPVNDDNDPPVSEPPVAENEDPKVAKRSRIQADPLVMSRCSTWQNAFLKEPNEDTEPYPWRMPIPKEELEPASVHASRGSNRDVAIGNDHEIRLDADRVHK